MRRGKQPVPQSEGDTNLSGLRRAWQSRALDAETRALLADLLDQVGHEA